MTGFFIFFRLKRRKTSIDFYCGGKGTDVMAKIAAKKSLGQNFLQDDSVIENIVSQSGVNADTDVLEIGPGLGAVTDLLVERARNVVAVEIDDRLYHNLVKKHGHRENFTIFNQDILETDLSEIVTDNMIVVANLPYYITTPIITKLVENPCGLKSLTVMVQLEVAKRICADHTQKDYGAISVFSNYHCDTELLFTVPPEAFDPIPKVTSAVMKLTFRDEKAVSPKEEQHFFSVVKAAFANRRKTLANCLMQAFSLSREEAVGFITSCGLSDTIRGEKLSLSDFCELSNRMVEQGK